LARVRRGWQNPRLRSRQRHAAGSLITSGNDVRTALLCSIVFVTFAVLVPASEVAAHSATESTWPANDERVEESPASLGIRFDGDMRITRFELSGPDGQVALAGRPGAQPARQFETAPAAPLAQGEYRVEWRALAADGHLMSGGFRFTVL
jgi:copper resistance protein C